MTHQLDSSFLPSLQRCVSSLERSTKRLKSSVAILDEATGTFPKLKTLTRYTKHFELVSEQGVKNARSELAKEIEPELFALLDKAVEMVITLESKEQELISQVNMEVERARQRHQHKSAVKSGLSNIKRLQSLTKRTAELSISSKELDGALDQKRREFGSLIERANDHNMTGGLGAKKIRRLSSTRSQGLGQIEESKKEDIRRCEQEINALKEKITARRKEIEQCSALSTGNRGVPMTAGLHPEFKPNDIWAKYMAQYDFFITALQSELKVVPRDKGAFDDAVAIISKTYDQELQEMVDTSDQELNAVSRNKVRKLTQLQALCKQLFPRDNVGITMARVIELLVENPYKECYYSDLVMTQFPANEEKRHNFGKAVEILKSLSVIEVMHEVREVDDIEASKELVVRIKFDDPTKEAL